MSKLQTIDEVIQSKRAAFMKSNKEVQTIIGQVKLLNFTRMALETEFDAIKKRVNEDS